jgi:pimeloyl-ACP methyl ester carboxylesterase
MKLESFLSLLYPQDVAIWKTDLGPIGKAKAFIQAGRKTPLPTWETKADRAYRIALFKSGGMTGPLNWYKANIRDIDAKAVSEIPPQSVILTKPTLFIGGTIDYVTRPEVMQMIADQGRAEGWLPNLKVKIVENGSHWVLIEKHREVSDLLIGVAKNLK